MPSSLRSKIQSGSREALVGQHRLHRLDALGQRRRAAGSARSCSGEERRRVHGGQPSASAELLERPSASHRLRLRADRVAPRVGALVAALDQQPLRLGAAAGALQRPAAAQLLALEPERQVAALERLLDRAVGRGCGRCRRPTRSPRRRRSPDRSRPRSRRSRAGGPRPRRPAASRADRSTGPSAPPRT